MNSNKKVCIVSISAAFANAGTLQQYLDCDIALQHTDLKGFHGMLTKTPYGLGSVPEADHYIFAGAGVLLRTDVAKLKGKKTVIITDSHYLSHTEEIDKIISDNDISVHCMIDLWEYCDAPNKTEYFQPFNDLGVDIVKNEKLTVAHSPFSEYKMILKGTKYIKEALSTVQENNDIETDFIIDVSWRESILRKVKCQFFVDQLVLETHGGDLSYSGGVGKSGIEAMLLKCLVFSSGKSIDTGIPKPPYVEVNSVDELIEKLTHYIKNPLERDEKIEAQYQWAKKYTNVKYVVEKLLN